MTRHRYTDANGVKRHVKIVVNVCGDLEVFIGQHGFVFEIIFGCQMKAANGKMGNYT